MEIANRLAPLAELADSLNSTSLALNWLCPVQVHLHEDHMQLPEGQWELFHNPCLQLDLTQSISEKDCGGFFVGHSFGGFCAITCVLSLVADMNF